MSGIVTFIVLRGPDAAGEFVTPAKAPEVRSPSPAKSPLKSPVRSPSPPKMPSPVKPLSPFKLPSPKKPVSTVEYLVEGVITLRLLEALNVVGIRPSSTCYVKAVLWDDAGKSTLYTCRSASVAAKHLK